MTAGLDMGKPESLAGTVWRGVVSGANMARTFCWKTAVALGLALAVCHGGDFPATKDPERAGSRLNLVLLLTDDQRYDTLGCMGNGMVRTPHLDRLAAEGALFRNAFVTTSICAVSRASIFSGQYARRHGIRDFDRSFSDEAFARTYPGVLRAGGYWTGFIGKYGVGTVMPTNQFDFWAGFPGQGQFFSAGSDTHLTRRMGEQAETFLRQAPPNRPFCLSVSFKAPHAQDGAPREFPPDAVDEKLYQDVTIPVPATATETAFEREPAFVQKSEGRTRWKRRFASAEMFQRTVKDYYRLITGVDREVGRLREVLRELALDTNTVIVFTSDNGWFMGEHGMADKWLMYEESIRVPLMIYDPRLPAVSAGLKVEPMVLNIDLAPTLLDYAGLKAPETMQGRSLRLWVEGGKPADWRQEWFYEHDFGPDIIPPSEGIRTVDWKYMIYPRATPVVEKLFDMRADAREERDLIGAPGMGDVLNRMREAFRRVKDAAE